MRSQPDIVANVKHTIELLKQCRDRKVEVAVFPECSVSGYSEAIGPHTRVTLIHEPFARVTDFSDYPQGWAHFLGQLKRQVEAA